MRWWRTTTSVVRTACVLCSSLKPVSHQPCGSLAPVCDDNFLSFVWQPQGVVYYTTRLPSDKQGLKAAATSKTKVYHVRFLCDLCAFSERCKTATRHARLPQDYCKTRKVFVRLTKNARLSKDNSAIYRKAAARMLRNVRLQLKIAQ